MSWSPPVARALSVGVLVGILSGAPARAEDPARTDDGAESTPEDTLEARLEQAEAAFRYQDYERTIRLLQPLVAEGRVKDSPRQTQVLEWLGASYWFTGARDAARLTFSSLLKVDPGYELDRLFYPRQLIAFFDTEKKRLKDLGFIGGPTTSPEGEGRRLTLVRTVTERRLPAIAYLMPFGVGQFANGHRTRGTLLAVLQGVGLALNIGAWLGVESLKIDGSDRVSRDDRGEARLLRALWWSGSALFLGSYAGSVTDGFVNRPPAREIRRDFEILDPDEFPGNDQAGVRLRVAPAAVGYGLGIEGSF